MNTLKIGCMCATKYSLEIVKQIKDQIKIELIIGLKKPKNLSQVSGYLDISDFCKKEKIKYYLVNDYSLKNEEDKQNLLKENLDLLLILGWQRLLPSWLIDNLKIGAIGIHGSPYGITKGRGRSPQNWALILNKKKFKIAIFKLDKNIDSGNIIQEKEFSYTILDTVEISYLKIIWLTSQMLKELLLNPSLEETIKKSKPQKGNPFYLPQRKPEDGVIDWNLTSFELYNFCRALTKPYPGCFTLYQDTKIIVWKLIPFTISMPPENYRIGQICITFEEGKYFVVRCKDGFVLIQEWEEENEKKTWEPQQGMIFSSKNFKDTMESLIQRHYHKYPDLPINKEILKLASRKD